MRTRAWPIATIAAMFSVVATFVAATLIVRWHATSGDSALSMVENGAPSVRLLGRARSDLRDLRLAARAVQSQRAGEQAPSAVRQARKRLGADIAAARETPMYPGEQASTREVEGALDRLDAALGALFGPTPVNGNAVGLAAEELDHRLEELHDINAGALERDAAELLGQQRASLNVALILDAVGLLLAALATAGLIVVARRLLRLEREKRRAVEERAAELNAFAARVAHDLMSPLATVALSLGTVAQPGAPVGALAERANRALHRARSIVDGLLDFSRAGGRPSPDARAKVAQVVAGVVDEAQPLALQKDIHLTVGEVPECTVVCAPGILAVILTNLIDNALKYMGDGGERRVNVRVERHARRVRLEVDDTGPGLPAGFETIAFEPYRRGRSDRPGLGLGLATVKRLVEAHHGKVGVSARHPSGARFWVELPRAPEDATAEAPALSPQPAG